MNNEILMARSKNYTNQVALGISNMRTSGSTVYFTVAATGEEVSVTLPAPSDGQDGVSVTGVSDKGNGKFTLLLSNGSETEEIHTLQGIKGDKGNPGEKGDPGYTPVKGTDYWTSEDISEIQSYIDTQIGGALNGSY